MLIVRIIGKNNAEGDSGIVTVLAAFRSAVINSVTVFVREYTHSSCCAFKPRPNHQCLCKRGTGVVTFSLDFSRHIHVASLFTDGEHKRVAS